MAQHFVSNKDESPRMFKNNVLDFFSRVHWSIPLFTWIPVVIFCLYRSFAFYDLSVVEVVLCFICAMATWTFAEYILHRFVFHFHPKSDLGKRFFFLIHGVHHDYPNDSYRLVMPPLLSIPLAVPFYFLFLYTLGAYHLPFFAGFLCGYLMYDMLHYSLHHASLNSSILRRLKEHHMLHHYKDPENGFGVSIDFWDIVFRTTFKLNEKKVKEVEHNG